MVKTSTHPNRTVRVKDLNRFKRNLDTAESQKLQDVGYDTTEKKLTKTVGETVEDIATAKKIATDGMDGMQVVLTTTTEGSDTIKTFTIS